MSRKNLEIINQTFGCYKILEILPDSKKSRVKCICTKCGNIRELDKYKVLHNKYEYCNKCVRPSKATDLSGKTFGRLLVLERVPDLIQPSGQHKKQFKCLCSCGNTCVVQSSHLVSGHTTSCGCFLQERNSEKNLADIANKRFGKLTVLNETLKQGNVLKRKCLCDCGNIVYVRTTSLISGHTLSCGCLNSKAEYELIKYLNLKNIKYRTQMTFPECKHEKVLPFDFGILNNDSQLLFLVELQGAQHYYPFTFHSESKEQKLLNLQHRQELDQIKRDFCKMHSIPLVEIKYSDFDKKEQIIKNLYNQYINSTELFPIPTDAIIKRAKNQTRKCHIEGIIQIDLQNKKIIKIWDSLKQIQKALGILETGIIDCCNGRLKTYKNFGWAYNETSFNLEAKLNKITAPNKTTAKSISQYTKQGEFIKKWNSITEAANALNMKHQNISACCRGESKSAGGFIWKFNKNANT